jgi:hypothetical protein
MHQMPWAWLYGNRLPAGARALQDDHIIVHETLEVLLAFPMPKGWQILFGDGADRSAWQLSAPKD